MLKIPFLLISFLIFSSLTAQVSIKDFEDASIYFNGLFDKPSSLDQYGNIVLDMGSASAGRIQFRITDVNISMEERPEEPGCADICPPRVIINFNCTKSECINDPVVPEFGKHSSGSVQIFDLKRGKKVYEYLTALKQFISRN